MLPKSPLFRKKGDFEKKKGDFEREKKSPLSRSAIVLLVGSSPLLLACFSPKKNHWIRASLLRSALRGRNGSSGEEVAAYSAADADGSDGGPGLVVVGARRRRSPRRDPPPPRVPHQPRPL